MTPEEAWPLKQSSPLDLLWLRMGDGKKEIWKLAQPLRGDSVFLAVALEQTTFFPTPPNRLRLEALPSNFLNLYDLSAMSTSDNNPYYAAASTLAQSLNSDCAYSTIVNFLIFISHIPPDYKVLLERKDPRALLLLAYWYAKVCQFQLWWIWRRAVLECQAICIYLERYHSHETVIQELLKFPRTVFDIVWC